jgi:hypothetical protein
MIKNLRTNKTLWFTIAVLGLIASIVGILYQGIYDDVVDFEIMSGIFSQDIVTILVCVIVLFLTLRMKEDNTKKQIVVLGIIIHLFYGYGIYVIEQLYTIMYFVYMAIFGMSAYAIIYFLMSIKKEKLSDIQIPRSIRNISIIFAFINPLMFIPLWSSKIIPLILSGEKLEFMFSVFILDLCFIMPAFIIIAILAIKNRGWGILMIPPLFIIGFTMLLSVAVGGVLKPLYDQSIEMGELFMYIVLSVVFFVLTVVYLNNLKINSLKK